MWTRGFDEIRRLSSNCPEGFEDGRTTTQRITASPSWTSKPTLGVSRRRRLSVRRLPPPPQTMALPGPSPAAIPLSTVVRLSTSIRVSGNGEDVGVGRLRGILMASLASIQQTFATSLLRASSS
ncbi:hypothetical protein XA68_12890 [Ophiocordyceps unilateralis]|uniref:Uncharacterized protein n=1 Tax=Ophiocordyceps unilateralis TaxID=268505 RepID=A0A2A9PDQ7_OPHUN|nr:hypothetical protein XA68_12890 [Ophiocordyceps unilateralis]